MGPTKGDSTDGPVHAVARRPGRAATGDRRRDPGLQRPLDGVHGRAARSGVLRAGAPFAAAGQVVQRGTVSDVELREVDIGGFLLIEAESAEAAARIAEEAPN